MDETKSIEDFFTILTSSSIFLVLGLFFLVYLSVFFYLQVRSLWYQNMNYQSLRVDTRYLNEIR